MKNKILFVATILMLASDPTFGAERNQFASPGKYQANEATIDLFGSGTVGQQTINNITKVRVNRDIRLGAGVGMNYFLTRNIGFGVAGYSDNIGHSFVDNASASLIGRFPLGGSGFAPYVFGGGGRQFDPTELWFGHAGAGMEYRFTPTLGVFVDARYVFTDGTKNYGQGRVGLRLGF